MNAYDPEADVAPAEWLKADEGERLESVFAYHSATKVSLPDPQLHAVIHVVVENQLALGEPVVAGTLARLRAEGLTRHEALHAIGTVLAEDVYRLIRAGDDPSGGEVYQRYLRRLQALTASGWRA